MEKGGGVGERSILHLFPRVHHPDDPECIVNCHSHQTRKDKVRELVSHIDLISLGIKFLSINF